MTLPVEVKTADAWISSTGLERWEHVLKLPLPPLELVEFKGVYSNHKYKGCFLFDRAAALIQARVHREDLSPTLVFPVSVASDIDFRQVLLCFWLNYLFRRFSEISAHQQNKIIEKIPVQHVMNGPSFLLMTGKAKAEELLVLQDLKTT